VVQIDQAHYKNLSNKSKKKIKLVYFIMKTLPDSQGLSRLKMTYTGFPICCTWPNFMEIFGSRRHIIRSKLHSNAEWNFFRPFPLSHISYRNVCPYVTLSAYSTPFPSHVRATWSSVGTLSSPPRTQQSSLPLSQIRPPLLGAPPLYFKPQTPIWR